MRRTIRSMLILVSGPGNTAPIRTARAPSARRSNANSHAALAPESSKKTSNSSRPKSLGATAAVAPKASALSRRCGSGSKHVILLAPAWRAMAHAVSPSRPAPAIRTERSLSGPAASIAAQTVEVAHDAGQASASDNESGKRTMVVPGASKHQSAKPPDHWWVGLSCSCPYLNPLWHFWGISRWHERQ